MSTAVVILSLVCLACAVLLTARYCVVLQRRQVFRSGFTLKDIPEPEVEDEDPLVALEEEEFDLNHD